MHIRTGTAGWGIPRPVADEFAGEGSQLERYARVLPCVEIDSSFYRPHRVQTYARWAASTPPDFRFAVKLPRAVTHEARLRGADAALDAFFAQVAGLGDKLEVVLAQLPPSLRFDEGVVGEFLDALRSRFGGVLACEPRHASWFEERADATLARARVARVAADPAVVPAAAQPGGWLGEAGDGAGATLYWRWHGSPRMYWSGYDESWLRARAQQVARWPEGTRHWCVFDNTAAGAAAADALAFRAALPGRH